MSQRSHSVIVDGGAQPNVVPPTASNWYYFRQTTYDGIMELWKTGDEIAKGAAMMTGTTLASTRVLGSAWPQHFNRAIAETTYANIQKADTGRASAIFSTQRQASAAFGVAILSTVFFSWRNHVTTGAQPTPKNLLSAFHVAFGASIVISFVGAAYAWFFINDIDAAPTMNPKPPKTAAVNG